MTGQTTPEPLGPETTGSPREGSKLNPKSGQRIPIAREREVAADERIGTYVGPYLIQKKLAKGGMGHVFLAYDEALRRRVALKIMEPGLVSDEDALKRFEREARAAAAVQHRNIAGIYMVGLADSGQPFLAMEFIGGGSLMNLIRNRTPLTFSQILHLMEQVSSALQAAKRLNIIHRDIKPANIMLTEEGEAKVVDFGLAKIFFEDSYMTQEGMVLGTPSYMAPEQGQGRVVDHRADIYSLGATFYHITVGRPPFTADSPVQIMMKHVTAPLVLMRSINPNVPMELDDIISRCMRKDVDERYQDYENLIADIQRVRLMCTTREKGAVVGVEKGPETRRVTGTELSMSAMLPNPPTVAGAPVHASQALPSPPPLAPASVRATVIQEEEGEPSGGWTQGRIIAVSTAAVIILIGLVFGSIQLLTAEEESSSSREGGQAAVSLLQKALQAQNGEASQITEYDRYQATLEILRSLRTGVANFEITEERLPANLQEIARDDRVLINFDLDDSGNPLDGWQTPLALEKSQRRLRSAGLDHSYYTADDILIGIDGTETVPDEYQRLQPSPR